MLSLLQQLVTSSAEGPCSLSLRPVCIFNSISWIILAEQPQPKANGKKCSWADPAQEERTVELCFSGTINQSLGL